MSLNFKIVQLFKDRTLGSSWSRGTVCRAKCDGVHCAAKIINEGCYSPAADHKSSHKKDRVVPAFKKLEQEVEFFGTIRHSSLVKYLAVHRDYTTGLPVVLLELMDYSLTEILENSSQSLSFHQQTDICHDVAEGLAFLHSYGIVHRYLSSNNVLLNTDFRAKVGDFGTSKMVDMDLQASSRNPHVNVYLPPESLSVPPHYSEKTDCFSFGVLVVQILTRRFPSPIDRSLAETEVERRKDHIGMVDPSHPLLSTAIRCLRDNAGDRPTAQELCERIAAVKGNDYKEPTCTQPGSEDVTSVDKQTIVSRLSFSNGGEDIWSSWKDFAQDLKQRDGVIANLRQEIEELKQQLEEARKSHSKEIAQKNWMIAESEVYLGRVNRKLEKSEEARASLERQSLAFEAWAQQPSAMAAVESKRKIKLEWVDEELCSPFRRDFSRFCCNAVVDGDMVLFKTALSPEIYAFDSADGSWTQVPVCPHVNGYCSIAVVNGLLTTVGDYDYGERYSNRLFSLMAQDQHWRKAFPNMPTKRCLTTVLCTGTALIVAGGRGKDRLVKDTVEVMNTESCKWFSAADLPEPLFCSTATVCGDRIYIAGGKDRYSLSTPAVYTCLLSALLKSCKSRLFRTHHPLLSDPVTVSGGDRPSIWSRVTDLPVVGSTCVSLNGHLLAVGGRELNHSATTTIHVYNSTDNCWVALDHRMSTPRSECFAAVLPDNRLLIAGGYVAASNIASTVEIATIIS